MTTSQCSGDNAVPITTQAECTAARDIFHSRSPRHFRKVTNKEGDSGFCRTKDGEGKGTFTVEKTSDAGECEELCNFQTSCNAYEFTVGSRCELHTGVTPADEIATILKDTDVVCFKKLEQVFVLKNSKYPYGCYYNTDDKEVYFNELGFRNSGQDVSRPVICTGQCGTNKVAVRAGSPGTVWINELRSYSNDDYDRVELAAPSNFDLVGYALHAYNGEDRMERNAVVISEGSFGTPDANQLDHTYSYFTVSLPMGHSLGDSELGVDLADAVVLVDPQGAVVQFLSFGGQLEALDGPAKGMMSVDIGVEAKEKTKSESLQLIPRLTGHLKTNVGHVAGSTTSSFSWKAGLDDTFGKPNVQLFVRPNSPEDNSRIQLVTICECTFGWEGSACDTVDLSDHNLTNE